MRVYAFRGICIDDKRHWNPRFPLLLFSFFFYQPAAIRIPKAYRFRAISWNAHLERVSSVSRSSKRSLSRPSRTMNFTVGSSVNVPRNWELQFPNQPLFLPSKIQLTIFPRIFSMFQILIFRKKEREMTNTRRVLSRFSLAINKW